MSSSFALCFSILTAVKKNYIDQADGAAALSAFIKATGLPTPTLVNSGGGLHVYWPLTRDVTVDEWKPVARSLKQLCTKQVLHADPSVTTDAARILRVPGTNNFKNGQSRPVQIITVGQPVSLEELSEILPLHLLTCQRQSCSAWTPHRASWLVTTQSALSRS